MAATPYGTIFGSCARRRLSRCTDLSQLRHHQGIGSWIDVVRGGPGRSGLPWDGGLHRRVLRTARWLAQCPEFCRGHRQGARRAYPELIRELSAVPSRFFGCRGQVGTLLIVTWRQGFNPVRDRPPGRFRKDRCVSGRRCPDYLTPGVGHSVARCGAMRWHRPGAGNPLAGVRLRTHPGVRPETPRAAPGWGRRTRHRRMNGSLSAAAGVGGRQAGRYGR